MVVFCETILFSVKKRNQMWCVVLFSGMYRVWYFLNGLVADWRAKDDRYSSKGIQVLLVNAM